DLQDAALRHAAARDPALPVPRLLGRARVDVDDGQREARLLTWLDGVSWSEHGGHGPRLLQTIGAAGAPPRTGPPGPGHPAASRPFGWNMLQALDQRDALAWIPDDRTRELAAAALDDFEQRALPRLASLPSQLIHNDGHTDNVVVNEGRAAAIVDFGDV